MSSTMHRAPIPDPAQEPFDDDDVPSPVPQDDPVPDHNPSQSITIRKCDQGGRWRGVALTVP